jgi:hypothetical protein
VGNKARVSGRQTIQAPLEMNARPPPCRALSGLVAAAGSVPPASAEASSTLSAATAVQPSIRFATTRGQCESLVPLYTHSSVPLSLSRGRGDSTHTPWHLLDDF